MEKTMKRILGLALLACVAAGTAAAQAVDVNVCDVVKHPTNFDGKIVRIKGVVFSGLDSFIIKDASGDCGFPVDAIWLEYPQGTKAKSGPAEVVHIQPAHNFAGTVAAPTRAAVTLDAKSKEFKQFDSLLAQPHKSDAMCLGCARYEVAATLTGRLDAVADASLKHDGAGKITGFGGFGNLNQYPARLVLQSVTDITPKELDYAAADAAVKKQQSTQNLTPADPMESIKKLVDGLHGTPTEPALQRLYAALPKKGEHNGVIIVKGNTAEEKDEAQGKEDAPDGVLYTVSLNSDRLQGDAYARALVHAGQHISDARQPADATPPFILEYNAWSMTITAAVFGGQKTLTLSGGTLAWDLSWPPAERTDKMNEAINTYLNKFAAINR
jgi:hypothetical protein